jgi:ribosome-associated heat shock protein Hsp15
MPSRCSLPTCSPERRALGTDCDRTHPVSDAPEDKLRVDKWLWAARFFKTRSLAADAVDSGKVLVNGTRVKPAKALKLGDELQVRTPGFEYTVHVAALSDRRAAAAIAAALYAETAESRRKREQAKLQGSDRDPTFSVRGRPTKRTRRQLEKLRGEPD